MPKTSRSRSRATRSSFSHPYARRSKSDVEDTAGTIEDEAALISPEDKEVWETTRCCICLESPHNGVLLICAGHEKGCRPYVCDTSKRHSACLDTYKRTMMECLEVEGKERELRLPCPLCRGTVTGQKVNRGARHFWNQKERPCAKESCNFKAKYTALRLHARKEHPHEHPTEVAPEAAQNWQRAERERDMQDVLSAAFTGPNGEPPSIDPESRGWTVYFLFHMMDGEVGGFSVARRFVVGAGPGRRAASTSTRRFRWGMTNTDSDDDADGDTEEHNHPGQQPVAQPTHGYYTRSRQEEPIEQEPSGDAGAGSSAGGQQGTAHEGEERQPPYRTRSVGLGASAEQSMPDVEFVGERDGVEATAPTLSWRGVSGSQSIGRRRLQRLGRIRMTGARSAFGGTSETGVDLENVEERSNSIDEERDS